MIHIDLTADSLNNGEELRGQAHWQSAGKEPRNILIRCRWRIEGKGCAHEHIVDEYVEHEIGTRTEMAIPFHFKIPLEGPLSYEGKLFHIVWEIVVRVGPFAFVAPWSSHEQETKLFTVKARRYDPAEYADEDGEDDEEDEEDEEDAEES